MKGDCSFLFKFVLTHFGEGFRIGSFSSFNFLFLELHSLQYHYFIIFTLSIAVMGLITVISEAIINEKLFLFRWEFEEVL